MKRLRSGLVIELRSSKESAVPTEFRVFAAGANESTRGTFLFDEKAAASVMEEFSERGTDIVIDYNHGSTDEFGMMNPAMAAKAAGWCALELRNGELWAVNVRWTKPALAALEAGEWRYISPTFTHDKDNRPQSILAIALENIPALHNLEPLVAASAEKGTKMPTVSESWVPMCFGRSCCASSVCCQACCCKQACCSVCCCPCPPDASGATDSGKMQMHAALRGKEIPMRTVASALRLSDAASEADVLGAVARLSATSGELASLCAATGKSTTGEAIGVLQGLKAEADKVPTLTAKLTAIEKAGADAKADGLIKAATEDGRLPPAKVDGARKLYADHGMPALEASLSMLSPVVATAKDGKEPGKEPEPVVALTADQKDIAKRLGLDPQKIIATAKAV